MNAFGNPATCGQQVLGFAAPPHDGCAFFASSLRRSNAIMGLRAMSRTDSMVRRHGVRTGWSQAALIRRLSDDAEKRISRLLS